MQLPEHLISELKNLARMFPKHECCGILTSDYKLYPIKNVSKTPANSFVFAKVEYFETLSKLALEGLSILAIYHTHPSGAAKPSQADLDYIKRSKINALIVSTGDWKWIGHDAFN